VTNVISNAGIISCFNGRYYLVCGAVDRPINKQESDVQRSDITECKSDKMGEWFILQRYQQWIGTGIIAYRLSVRLSVTLCIVAVTVGEGVESSTIVFIRRHFIFTSSDTRRKTEPLKFPRLE